MAIKIYHLSFKYGFILLVKLYRQLVVRLFKQADSQHLVLLLKDEMESTRMSLVWLTISKSLVGSIVLVNVRSGEQG